MKIFPQRAKRRLRGFSLSAKIPLSVSIFCLLTPLAFGEPLIKKPNVSGQFYDSNPEKLSKDIDGFFAQANVAPLDKKIPILISPHAGYIYSGPVAAYGYKAISNQLYKTIVVIAPSHYSRFEGVSIWPQGSFETPLGFLEVDEDFANALKASSAKFGFMPEAFQREHSLEVQLPFLQKTFSNFKIVPIVMGYPSLENCEALASALAKIINERQDVLIVVSTDMSHYFDDVTAKSMDQSALAKIKNFDIEGLWQEGVSRKIELCGLTGVVTALLYAKKQGIDGVEVLRYANSGDVTGDKTKVVGYSSIIFYKKENLETPGPAAKDTQVDASASNQQKNVNISPGEGQSEMKTQGVAPLTIQQKKRLLEIVRVTIETFIRDGKIPEFNETDPRLSAEEGAFVTLHKHGQLRGCIGNILGHGPLFRTVRDMAIAASSQDPRFPKVAKDELKDIELEISVLSKPWRMTDSKEFKPGVHGAIIKRGFHQGVFLPQVATETGWGTEEFFSNLCAQKAGLEPEAWKDPQTVIQIFTADVFSQKDLGK